MGTRMDQRLIEIAEAIAKENAAKEAEQTVFNTDPITENYLDLKRDLKKLEALEKDLRAQLEKELSIASMNGMTTETWETIVSLQREIENTQEEAAKKLTQVQAVESRTRNDARTKIQGIGESIKNAFSKIKEYTLDRIISCVAATKALTEKVREANDAVINRGAVAKDTLNTNLVESVYQVGRNWMAIEYWHNQELAAHYDNLANSLEKAYTRKAEIKEALKDLGRAFTKKGRQHVDGEMTPEQSIEIQELRSIAEDYRAANKELEHKFEQSRSVSLANLKGARDFRNESKVKEHSGLEKRFERAMKESIKSQTKASPEKERSQNEQKMERGI